MKNATHTFMALIMLVTSMAILSCAHAPPPAVPQSSSRERALYEQGLKALSIGDNEDAGKKFNDLLVEFPTTKWLPGSYFNWGRSLENMGLFNEAADKYKRVVEFYEGIPTREEAEALYRLSLCYENVGDDGKMILALIELNNQGHLLSRDVNEIEIPARLAAAYARMGNPDQARSYFSKATAGLKKIRRNQKTAESMIWMPKTLYSMGHVPAPHKGMTSEEFHNYVTSLEASQGWLVRAVDLNDKNWSGKAADDLLKIYQEAWSAIDLVPTPDDQDKVQALKVRQDQQRAMATDLDTAISRLKLERLPSTPGDPEPQALTEIFNRIASIEHRLNLLIQSPDVQDQPTTESQTREGLKRQGQIVEKKKK